MKDHLGIDISTCIIANTVKVGIDYLNSTGLDDEELMPLFSQWYHSLMNPDLNPLYVYDTVNDVIELFMGFVDDNEEPIKSFTIDSLMDARLKYTKSNVPNYMVEKLFNGFRDYLESFGLNTIKLSKREIFLYMALDRAVTNVFRLYDYVIVSRLSDNDILNMTKQDLSALRASTSLFLNEIVKLICGDISFDRYLGYTKSNSEFRLSIVYSSDVEVINSEPDMKPVNNYELDIFATPIKFSIMRS